MQSALTYYTIHVVESKSYILGSVISVIIPVGAEHEQDTWHFHSIIQKNAFQSMSLESLHLKLFSSCCLMLMEAVISLSLSPYTHTHIYYLNTHIYQNWI